MDNGSLLFESVFKRKLSDAGTREYLTQVADEHPYFSPAQFYLLLQADKETFEYQQQAAKTAILFNNPYWLQFQLQEKSAMASRPIAAFTAIEESIAPVSDHSYQSEAAVSVEKDEAEDFTQGQPVVVADELVEDYKEADLAINEQIANEGNDTDAAAQVPAENQDHIETPVQETEELTNNDEELVTSTYEKETVPGIPLEKQEAESIISSAENEKKDHTVSSHFNNASEPLVNEAETEEELEALTEEEAQPLNFRLNIDTSGTTEETIAFEPLHTTDYFASLGIRLSGEIKPNDKLGKQLKSFTEWLKTMKKIHSEQLPQQGAQTDVNIQQLAEQSNKEDAVLTEAMADVLLQQGKADKAIEVYKKLSLFNPSKSAYFAAKIDQLKEH